MIRRALGAVGLVVAVAACTGSPGSTAPTTIPPTTRVPAPISPPGVADRARDFVSYLSKGQDDSAFSVLDPVSQATIGGRDGYAAVARDLATTWGRWAKAQATYDGLPIAAGRAVVVIHTTAKDGSERAGVLPMRAVGDDWYAQAVVADPGKSQPDPADRAKIAPLPELAVGVESGVDVRAFVDGQPADVGAPAEPRLGTVRVPYRPSVGLRPGWHLVVLVFTRGDTMSGTTVRYRVPEPD